MRAKTTFFLSTRPLALTVVCSMSTGVVEGSSNGEDRPITPLREVRTILAACSEGGFATRFATI